MVSSQAGVIPHLIDSKADRNCGEAQEAAATNGEKVLNHMPDEARALSDDPHRTRPIA